MLGLNSPKCVSWRLVWIRNVELAGELDQKQYLRLMGYPEDLPDLARFARREAMNDRKGSKRAILPSAPAESCQPPTNADGGRPIGLRGKGGPALADSLVPPYDSWARLVVGPMHMACRDPFIELAGFRRLEEEESRIWYAPPAFGLAGVGLVGAGVILWSMSRGILNSTPYLVAGYAIFLGSYGLLFLYYHWYRFSRVKCPGCGQTMQPFLTDSPDNPCFRFLGGLRIGGRHFQPPHDEHDRRPFVRLMLMVRACPACKTFVSCSRLHYQTCTEEELGQIRERSPTQSGPGPNAGPQAATSGRGAAGRPGDHWSRLGEARTLHFALGGHDERLAVVAGQQGVGGVDSRRRIRGRRRAAARRRA